MPQKSAYYVAIDKIEERLANEILEGRHPHQPKCVTVYDLVTGAPKQRPEHLWIMSLDNFTANTTAGNVCAAPLRTCAQSFLAGGHRLATVEEIAEWKEAGRRRLLENQAEDVRLKQRQEFHVTLPPEAAPARTK